LVSGPSGAAFGLYEPSKVYSGWVANETNSQWLAIYSGITAPASTVSVPNVSSGAYTIKYTFDLGSYKASDVSFGISAAVDGQYSSVTLNGQTLANTTGTVPGNSYGYFGYGYSVNGTASGLQNGLNTLVFTVTNGSNAAGLNVRYTDFAAIPEPSTYAAMLACATLALVVWRRRANR